MTMGPFSLIVNLAHLRHDHYHPDRPDGRRGQRRTALTFALRDVLKLRLFSRGHGPVVNPYAIATAPHYKTDRIAHPGPVDPRFPRWPLLLPLLRFACLRCDDGDTHE